MFELAAINNSCASPKRLKTAMKLDLNKSVIRRQNPEIFDAVLSTPDVAPDMLKLSSPELEKLMLQQRSETPGSGAISTPTQQALFPSSVTEEQERYARGFVDALLELHSQSTTVTVAPHGELQNTNSAGESSSVTECNAKNQIDNSNDKPLNGPYQPLSVDVSTRLKSESVDSIYGSLSDTSTGVLSPHSSDVSSPACTISPPFLYQNSPCAGVKRPHVEVQPPSDTSLCPVTSATFLAGIAPIDMVQQERIKLDRKRARNRVAATRCRERKLERISSLEEQVRQLKARNIELTELASVLRDNVCQMKLEIVTHVNGGCQLMLQRNGFR